ncbi:GNAT family N-acetyltransferase [Sporolactobacillus vineae]|uniref:GNAT family N-acetyltransferase n=1 Tax=Sporolactobacillus vineae TaxID=444463 RepID=UPI0002891511|nr:GNAT family protein [Sporolactobacillus vineae]
MLTIKIDEHVSLRLIDLKDAERIFELIDQSRDYLRKWLPWVDGTATAEDTKSFIKLSLRNHANGRGMDFVILLDGLIVGIAGINLINWTNKTAEIGYWLGEHYQGRGIMTKTASALTDYAFKQIMLNKVEIRAAAQNQKSRSIPERLGFKMEGCIRQAEWMYDHYVDHCIFGMLAAEWSF